jgi:hypothetical protein
MLEPRREPVLTCPGPYGSVVVGVSWEAAVGQVEQRRSLSLLDRGTLRSSPGCLSPSVPNVTFTGSEASPDAMQADDRCYWAARIRDSDNLLTSALFPTAVREAPVLPASPSEHALIAPPGRSGAPPAPQGFLH